MLTTAFWDEKIQSECCQIHVAGNVDDLGYWICLELHVKQLTVYVCFMACDIVEKLLPTVLTGSM